MHLVASATACSSEMPRFTSADLDATRTAGSSSGIFTRSIAARSLALMAPRNSTRHAASRELFLSIAI